ncbi:NAD(P)/FAD-dependent oxidoreductase [Roseivivax sediminis]|uniref:Glycine/D-amino acid oxidase n=1 Tax=Roseivivax sediminis TaxID=936889 RepID=A0A1I2DAS9_9RHOB|nr:FAD-binding oxidoreductase [Roseivivax sediminis]SFE77578.1 Glycine/D-amino acid oxidase [Roseivivax sediminis]
MIEPISLWDASAEEAQVADQSVSSVPVDLVIVGGGYTGLSTALHAAEAGLSVQILEAAGIGHGGSGRNVGLVNAGLWLPPESVAKALGPEHGPRFVKRFGEGPETVFDLIERHQIRCSATRTGTIHAAHAPAGMTDLRARHAQWRALGAPVRLLEREEAAAKIGSRAFHGGLLDVRAGTVNPMGYARGLARAAKGAGARLATGVAVTGLTPEAAGWQVETAQGAIRATTVVLATNAYTGGLWPGLDRAFTTIRFVQLATPPLGERAAHVLPEGQGVWDTGRIMRALRRDAAGRLVIGTMGRLHGTAAAGLTRRWAERQLARLFPELAGTGFEEAWEGAIAMTPDHLPRIQRLADGLYAPIGYNGRGITTGTIFGQALAALLTGAPETDLPLPVTGAAPVPRARLTSHIFDAAFTANQIRQGLW